MNICVSVKAKNAQKKLSLNPLRYYLLSEKKGLHAQECVEFARAVAEGKPSPVPAEQSLQVMAILDGIYRSQEIGGEVKIA